MNDPRALDPSKLKPFEPAMLDGEFDRDEPCEISGTHIASDDMALLARVPLAAEACLFENCDLSMADVVGIRDSRLVACKLRGTRFAKYARNVVFDSCQLIECSFRMMALDDVTFEKCQLTQNDFYESTLASVSLPGSAFQGVGFDRSTLRDVDLTRATDLQIGDPRTLRGASLCETQVPLIAARLAELSGIILRDC